MINNNSLLRSDITIMKIIIMKKNSLLINIWYVLKYVTVCYERSVLFVGE